MFLGAVVAPPTSLRARRGPDASFAEVPHQLGQHRGVVEAEKEDVVELAQAPHPGKPDADRTVQRPALEPKGKASAVGGEALPERPLLGALPRSPQKGLELRDCALHRADGSHTFTEESISCSPDPGMNFILM